MDTFSVLAAFVATLEVAVGALVIVLATRAWTRHGRLAGDAAAGDVVESRDARRNLLLALATVLTGLALAGWPLLHLLFESMVPAWPGIMCAQGISQIGAGARGATGDLPALATTALFAKPTLVFLCGCWIALHLAGRQTAGAPTSGMRSLPVLVTLALTGLVAVVDGGAVGAWLFIPKVPEVDSAGCCSSLLVANPGALPPVRTWAAPAFLVGAPLLAALSGITALRAAHARVGAAWIAGLVVLAALALPAARAFATDFATPVALHLPHHRCLPCLFQRAPESMIGAGLFLFATFAVGWTAALRFGTSTPNAGAERSLLRFAAFAYTGTVVLTLVGWLVASWTATGWGTA